MDKIAAMRRVLVATLVLLAGAVVAADPGDVPPPPELLLVETDRVQPQMLADYERALRWLVRSLDEHEIVAPATQFVTLVTDDLAYHRVTRIGSFADLDGWEAAWGSAREAFGPRKWGMIRSRTDVARYDGDRMLVRHRPDLSFAAGRRGGTGDAVLVTSHHVLPGREKDMENLLRDRAAALRGRQPSAPFETYQSILGQGLPMYVTVERGPSAEACHGRRAAIAAELGEEWQRLDRVTLALTARREIASGRLRPDLSRPGLSTSEDPPP